MPTILEINHVTYCNPFAGVAILTWYKMIINEANTADSIPGPCLLLTLRVGT